jgi:hypothetical protein
VEETGAKANETTAQLSKTVPRTTGTPLMVVKRKRKSRGNAVAKSAMKQLTTIDETKAQTEVKE